MKVADILDDEYVDDVPVRESVRPSGKPVNGKHDLQRRAENATNRFRKESR